MPNINHIVRGGHLGKDSDLRYLPNGDPVTRFSIATTKKWKDRQSGEMKESTDWINVSVFGKPAEWCASLKKGDGVIVVGEVLTRKYEKDGKDAYSTEIRASEVHKTTMMSAGGERPAAADKPPSTGRAAPARTSRPHEEAPFQDDDIPFAPRSWKEG